MLNSLQTLEAKFVAATAFRSFYDGSKVLNSEQKLVAAKRLLTHIRELVERLEQQT